MKNNATRTIRSEEITIDVRICATLAANRGGEVYLAAIAPNMELTVITLDEAPGILPCFEEDDACLNLPNTSLLLCYNPTLNMELSTLDFKECSINSILGGFISSTGLLGINSL